MDEKTIAGEKVLFFDKVTSTMDIAAEISQQEKPVKVVVAKNQTKGRGRYGKKWYSPDGGLYFSIIEKEPGTRLLSEITSFSLIEMFEEFGITCKIKFPNDIIYKTKKISGILIEQKGKSYIIGVGININNKIDAEVKGISMKQILKKTMDNDEVLEKFLIRYKLNIERFKENKEFYLKRWSELLQNE